MSAQPSGNDEPAGDAGASSAGPEGPGALEERGIPSVNRVRSLQSRVTVLLTVGFMSVTALGLLAWYYLRAFNHADPADSRVRPRISARAQTDVGLPPLGPIQRPRLAVNAPAPRPNPEGDPHSLTDTLIGPRPPEPLAVTAAAAGPVPQPYAGTYPAAAASHVAPRKSARQQALDRLLGGEVASRAAESHLAANGLTTAAAPRQPMIEAQSATLLQPPAPDADGSRGGLRALLKADAVPTVAARLLPTQRFLIPQGAFIDCTLETALDSTLPGMTTCITATDTFGADGQVVLLERGSKLVGETRGQVQQGQARVFVLWTEARTPNGVVIPLASPGTDELGRSGLPGEVDRHFFDRFGAALLLSVVDSAIQRTTTPSNSGGTVILNPSTSEAILTEILRGTLNIPPTVHKDQGDRIQVLVARDLDFRSVYELRLAPASR